MRTFREFPKVAIEDIVWQQYNSNNTAQKDIKMRYIMHLHPSHYGTLTVLERERGNTQSRTNYPNNLRHVFRI